MTTDPLRLADFWSSVLGLHERREDEDGWTWTVMADPDGNEFCVTDP